MGNVNFSYSDHKMEMENEKFNLYFVLKGLISLKLKAKPSF